MVVERGGSPLTPSPAAATPVEGVPRRLPSSAHPTAVPTSLGVGNAALGVAGMPTTKPRLNSRGNWTAEEVGVG